MCGARRRNRIWFGKLPFPPCIRPSKFLQNIKLFNLFRIGELGVILYASESHEHVPQLNVNIYVINIEMLALQEQRSRR